MTNELVDCLICHKGVVWKDQEAFVCPVCEGEGRVSAEKVATRITKLPGAEMDPIAAQLGALEELGVDAEAKLAGGPTEQPAEDDELAAAVDARIRNLYGPEIHLLWKAGEITTAQARELHDREIVDAIREKEAQDERLNGLQSLPVDEDAVERAKAKTVVPSKVVQPDPPWLQAESARRKRARYGSEIYDLLQAGEITPAEAEARYQREIEEPALKAL